MRQNGNFVVKMRHSLGDGVRILKRDKMVELDVLGGRRIVVGRGVSKRRESHRKSG